MAQIRQLTPAQLKPIYKKYMRKEFPVFELRPYRIMYKLIYKNKYIAYGYYDNYNNLQAYACIYLQMNDTNVCMSEYALLDYFAVVPELQHKGIGSAFLCALAREVPVECGLFIECESPHHIKSDAEKKICERRIQFYEKNGCVATRIKCKIFRITFDLMLLKTDAQTKIYNENETVNNTDGNEQDSKNIKTDPHTLLKTATKLYRNIYGKILSKIIQIYIGNIYMD